MCLLELSQPAAVCGYRCARLLLTLVAMGAVVPSLSGISVRYTFDAIEEMVGAGVIRSALSQLPVASREQFEQATAVSWIPMSVVAQVVNEIARLTHRDPEQLIDEAVRRGV